MAIRGDKSADYTQAAGLLSKLEIYVSDENWNTLVAGLGTLSHFWPRAIEWEKVSLANQNAGQPLEQTESQLTLTQRLAAIVAPNVEQIRSNFLSGDESNNDFFIWLDKVLTAADSPMAGQFMASIRQDDFERSFIAGAIEGEWYCSGQTFLQKGREHCFNHPFLRLQGDLKRAIKLAELAQKARNDLRGGSGG